MKNLVLLAALAAASAGAQPVYRCGSSYGTQPCAGATVIDVQDTSTAADAARARKGAEADMQRAREMEKARLAQEKAAPKAMVIAAPAPQRAASAEKKPPAKKGDAKKAKPEEFTAVVPGTGKPKK